MHIDELTAYLFSYLEVGAFSDASLNGLQIEGFKNCTKIATAVTASLEAIDAAIEEGADTLLVHHGLLWKGQMSPIRGTLKERYSAILESNINLLAYHLPLDANMEVGNNSFLCNLLSLKNIDYVSAGDPTSIAMKGSFESKMSISEIASLLADSLQTSIQVLGNCDRNTLISDVTVCSGSGSFLIDSNYVPKFEALITGDVNEQTYHMAKETGTPVFVLGHDASEQGGIKLLGDHIARRFDIEHIHLHFNVENEVAVYDYSDK